jgi:sulfur carrier protein
LWKDNDRLEFSVKTIKLIINGEEKKFKENSTISEILNELQVLEKVMATAVNMAVVKKDDWGTFTPKDGDKIELLQFVGGG